MRDLDLGDAAGEAGAEQDLRARRGITGARLREETSEGKFRPLRRDFTPIDEDRSLAVLECEADAEPATNGQVGLPCQSQTAAG